MAVTFNTSAAVAGTASAVTTIQTSGTGNLAPAAGSNILVLGALFTQTAGAPTGVTGVSITWGGTAMTLAGTSTATNNARMTVFCIPVGSTTTSQNMVATWTTSATPYLVAWCVNGANQTGGTTSCINFTSLSGTTSPCLISPTTATGDLEIAVGSSDHNTGIDAVGGTVTGTAIRISDSFSQNIWSMYRAGPTQSLGTTLVGTGDWLMMGFSIVAATAGDVFFGQVWL